MANLSDEEKNIMRPIFRGEIPGKQVCVDCGGLHERACPRVKRKVCHPNGNLTEIEYWPPGWETNYGDIIAWPEDVFGDGNE